MLREFIVYACPVGELNNQVEEYFTTTCAECGENAAHKYMPHCTLTGFFHDESTAIPIYIQALDIAWQNALTIRLNKPIVIVDFKVKPDFHYLKIESVWIEKLIANFANIAKSPTRTDRFRLKSNLHLTLAYKFPSEQQQTLTKIAKKIINPQAEVSWELRFYERHPDHSWTCHQSWKL
ncbi:MAG: hypothetical protein F6K40_00270 [Okeania sp. SIO3I5]|uniref:hypothetical protein n=1 Tax=Okeania sp. SIO3I5 TaxID=2607805 RepID=UPI0013BCD987|nr:hypothetical protein [Okeania sp. SIO3I5]NEQ34828.1 hypothetical protein [Okeania sp. SIO3I5]